MTGGGAVEVREASPREVARRDLAVIGAADIVVVMFVDDAKVPNMGDGGGYVAGDVAGFPRHVAQMMVDCGAASFDMNATLKREAPPKASSDFANGTLTARAVGETGLEFLQPWQGYAPGERAGFNEHLARRLITGGVAQPIPTGAAAIVGRTLKAIRDALTGR